MTRTPLRPLARILEARSRGENPDAIERENIRLRHEEMRDRARRRAEGRLLVLAVAFFVRLRSGRRAHGDAGAVRAGRAAHQRRGRAHPRAARRYHRPQGRILATNFDTHSLYAQPEDMVDPEYAAEKLVEIFPDLDRARLIRDFTGDRKFLWIRKTISPEQQQAVHDIGEPGLLFGPREMRLYPNGRLAAHVLGGASFGREGVHAAEVVGVAGIEKYLDERLRDPARAHEPLTLSLDLSVQAAMEQVLHGGMKIMNAKGASGILMEVETGEVVAVASLPDFDPNDRPALPTSGNQDDSPLFNRAVQGVYELGSVFKVFTIAQALELGLCHPDTMVNTESPLTWGRFRIRDFRNYGPELSVTKVIVKSSNVGTARIAMEIGAARQKAFLDSWASWRPRRWRSPRPRAAPAVAEELVGDLDDDDLLRARPVDQPDASGRRLCHDRQWRAAGGADPAARDTNAPGARVMSEATARAMRKMLRQVVTEGTASLGEVGLRRRRQDRHRRQAQAHGRLLRRQGDRHLRQRLSRRMIRNTCWWSRWTSRSRPRATSRAAPPAGPPCRSPPR